MSTPGKKNSSDSSFESPGVISSNRKSMVTKMISRKGSQDSSVSSDAFYQNPMLLEEKELELRILKREFKKQEEQRKRTRMQWRQKIIELTQELQIDPEEYLLDLNAAETTS